MNTKLVIVEGLPGFGKSTTAKLINDILNEMNIEAHLYLEGNLDHPADYDGVAYFTKDKFDELLSHNEEFKELLNGRVIKQGFDYFLPYQKLINETEFPDKLINTIFKNDIYELPLYQNIQLIVDKWRKFSESALKGSGIYIFESCFIQNPVTIGMIKYGAAKEIVINYVMELSKAIKNLNPLLIYINQNDLEVSFKKAVTERPKEWSNGFIDYYTKQGYGRNHDYQGLEGTIQVLEARKKLEIQIIDKLRMKKKIIDNSQYDITKFKSEIMNTMNQHL